MISMIPYLRYHIFHIFIGTLFQVNISHYISSFMCQEPQTLNGSTREVQVEAALSSTLSAFLPPLLEAAFGEIEFLNLLLQSVYTFSIIEIFTKNVCTQKREEMRLRFFLIMQVNEWILIVLRTLGLFKLKFSHKGPFTYEQVESVVFRIFLIKQYFEAPRKQKR